YIFYFQAEHGIRDFHVTGVQTCALPISCGDTPGANGPIDEGTPIQGGTATVANTSDFDAFNPFVSTDYDTGQVLRFLLFMPLIEIGRASCRERVYVLV